MNLQMKLETIYPNNNMSDMVFHRVQFLDQHYSLYIYINDLESHLKQVKPTFFADDTSVFISGHSIHSIQTEVDTTMNQLVEWFERNRLIINTQKTVAISFHHIQNNKPECPTINIRNKTITHTDSTKFLGLWLDQNLKWLTHIQILTRKLGKICFALRIVRQSS